MKNKIFKLVSIIVPLILLISFIGCNKKEKTVDNELNENETKATKIYNEYLDIEKSFEEVEKNFTDYEGYVDKDKVNDLLDEVMICAEKQKEKGEIIDISKNDTCIYMELESGIGYIYEPNIKEMCSSGNELKITTISPNNSDWRVVSNRFYAEFELKLGQLISGIDLGYSGSYGIKESAKMIKNSLNKYSYDENVDSLEGKNVTIDAIKELPSKSVIIWEGHGNYIEKNSKGEYVGSILATDIDADIVGISDNLDDVMNKRIVVKGSKLAVTSKFFKDNLKDDSLKESIIWLGTCCSAKDSNLADTLISKGACNVLGFSNIVSIPYEIEMRMEFMHLLSSKNDDGEYYSIKEALIKTWSLIGVKDSHENSYEAELHSFGNENCSLDKHICEETTEISDEKVNSESESVSKEKEINYEEEYYSYIKSELIPKYGLSNINSTQGIMKNPYDNWLNPSGILSAKIYDFDNDGVKELFLIRIEEAPEKVNIYNNQCSEYYFYAEVYSLVDDNIQLLDKLLLTTYNENDKKTLRLNSNQFSNQGIFVNMVSVDDNNYIVFEDNFIIRTFANGSNNDYWVLQYKNNKLNKVLSFTQTAGGSSEFEYTGYIFDSDNLTSKELLYSEWYEHQGSYESFNEALKVFFSKINIQIDDSFEYRPMDNSILSSENKIEKIFEYHVRNINSDFNLNQYTFEREVRDFTNLRDKINN